MGKEIKNKDASYYNNLLYKDSIALLIISIIYFIFMVVVLHSLNGLLYIILEAIIITKRNDEKVFGTLALISAILMVIGALLSTSVISFVYLILGVIYIIHSVTYLRKIKK